jgi:lysophospholipase L1-like esterase
MTNPAKLLSFHEQRFRLSKEPGLRRVFIVGGSCVALLQDQNGGPLFSRVEKALNVQLEKISFPGFPGPGLSVLREKLEQHYGGQYRFEIINCGAGSYGSHRLVPVVAEILDYEPDLILYYEGHNEFEEVEQMKYVPFRTLRMQEMLEHLAVYRLVRSRVTTAQTRQMVKPENREWVDRPFPEFITEEPCHPDFDAKMLADRMDALENNLEMMANLCRQRNVPLILATVPSNLKKPHEMCKEDTDRYHAVFDLYARGEFDAARDLAETMLSRAFHRQATEAENTVLRRVAARHALPLADVKAAIIAAEPNHFPGETLFWDDCHLYPEGNRILLDTFLNTIIEHVDFTTAPARLAPPRPR